MVDDGRAYVLLVSSWDYVFAWLPWTFPQMCLYHFRFLDQRFDHKHQPQYDEALRCIQPVKDRTVEPPPSEKHCKRAVLNIVGVQMISRDLAMLSWSAICSSRIGFRVKRPLTIRFVKPSFGWSGDGGQRSGTVRLVFENRGARTAEEIVPLQLLAWRKFPQFERLRIHLYDLQLGSVFQHMLS